ncbi:MAG: tRNA pseudouridine(55) synthase TruB [Frankiaceae bacterium]
MQVRPEADDRADLCGLLVVDKPAGWTSHDVVARVRRLSAIRRVGHAGTLDPMATGLLVLGLGRGTRLLGHLVLAHKEYLATIRLGLTTTTDDADGEVVSHRSATRVSAADVAAAMVALTGAIEQVPSTVSAIKVGGRRAYARARAGETVVLAPRRVRVDTFELLARREAGDREMGAAGECRVATGAVDLDVRVVCSSGVYVRALARDLGAALGVGASLTALRRTRSGCFSVADAQTIEELACAEGHADSGGHTGGVAPPVRAALIPLAAAVAAAFPRRAVTPTEAAAVAHGVRLPAVGLGPGPYGVFGPEGDVLALVEEREGTAKYLAVFSGRPG